MITLAGNTGWWIFLIVGIFALIGLVVFILRKKIPGLVNYEEQNEDEIAQENLSRILMDVEEDQEVKDGEDK